MIEHGILDGIHHVRIVIYIAAGVEERELVKGERELMIIFHRI